MTLAEMRTAVRTRLGSPSTDGFFTDAQLNDIINEALQAISSEDDWPWLQTSETITTVAGTGVYTPTAGWVRTKQLYIANYEPFQQMSLAEMDAIPDPGQPLAYAIFGEQVMLRPIPNAVFSVVHQYYRQEPVITVDGTSPLMPVMFHFAIVAYAAYMAHLRQSRTDRAAAELQAYEGWVRRMHKYTQRSQVPLRIRVRPGSLL